MTDNNNGSMQVDAGLVRQLAELLDDTRLTEIEVQDGDRRIRVVRNVAIPTHAAPAPLAAAPVAAGEPAAAPTAAPAAPAGDHPGTIKSPMVGTAYLSANPEAPPFVSVGAKVAAGDTLLIIEAMKTMNQIPAHRSGTITRILFEDSQPVEYGQPLVVIE